MHQHCEHFLLTPRPFGPWEYCRIALLASLPVPLLSSFTAPSSLASAGPDGAPTLHTLMQQLEQMKDNIEIAKRRLSLARNHLGEHPVWSDLDENEPSPEHNSLLKKLDIIHTRPHNAHWPEEDFDTLRARLQARRSSLTGDHSDNRFVWSDSDTEPGLEPKQSEMTWVLTSHGGWIQMPRKEARDLRDRYKNSPLGLPRSSSTLRK